MVLGIAYLMNKFTITLTSIIAICLVIAVFWFGGYIASNLTAKSMQGAQAKIAFAHMDAFKDIYSDLNSGCKEQALVRLEHFIDEQKMLMAEHVQHTHDKEFEEYISLRDPILIDELKTYNVNWDKKWIVPKCSAN